jgi:hypothetical protein
MVDFDFDNKQYSSQVNLSAFTSPLTFNEPACVLCLKY